MKSQDYFTNTLIFSTVHVKKTNYFYQKTTIQDIQDNITQHYI